MLTQGDHVVDFIETFLTLGGSYVGQPFIPLDWMAEAIRDIYALDPVTGKRKHRTYVLGVPRKNAKSTLGAALAVYQLVVDTADAAPQVISAAGDRKQAKLVFDEAKRMILASPELAEVCQVFRDEIRCSITGGTYKAVSADAGLAHGLNPSFVIVDEYHVHRTSDLYVALTTGSATRDQPLTLVISTAGHDLESPLGKLYQYGRRVESGEVDDPSFGFRWYGPREDENIDPADPAVWERFNPSISIMNLEEFASAYKSTPESEFIRYRLNGWTASQEAFLPHGAWDAREDLTKTLEPHDEVILGFDGAWKGDSTGLVAWRIHDLHCEVLGHWEAPIGDPHWRTPAREVEDRIRWACSTYSVREVVADPYRFEQSLLMLQEEGIPIVEFPSNSLARIIPATQAFYSAVMDGKVTHNGDPSLARHLANATTKADSRGIRIVKEYKASTKFIDLAVATILGLHRALIWRDEEMTEPQLLVL
jgi:phage terminase large subunit-like protein